MSVNEKLAEDLHKPVLKKFKRRKVYARGCVGAQRIMFLGRFLVQPTHLLSGGPRPARMWLILDLARSRCLDSENQDAIGNSL